MLRGHGGNRLELAKQLGCNQQEIIDMSSNINPLGPPPALMQYLADHVDAVSLFPEVDSKDMTAHFAEYYGLDPRRVLAGNGTTQIIFSLPRVLEIDRALIVGPTYSDYADACHLHNARTHFFLAKASQSFRVSVEQLEVCLKDTDVVYICNPNNPTGSLIAMDELESLCQRYPDIYFVIDESYLPFVQDEAELSLRRLDYDNLIILSSISKIFAVPGLRIGFIISTPEIIEKFKRFLQPWSVNSLAQLAVDFLMNPKNETAEFVQMTQNYIMAERQRFLEAAGKWDDIRLFPSTTNFFLAELGAGLRAEAVINRLARDRILLRNCQNFEGLTDRFIRISLKTSEVNQRLVERLTDLIGATEHRNRQPETRICGGG